MTRTELENRLDALAARTSAALMLLEVLIRTHPDPRGALREAAGVQANHELHLGFRRMSVLAVDETHRLFDELMAQFDGPSPTAAAADRGRAMLDPGATLVKRPQRFPLDLG